jgi:hypothetical protein
MSRNATRVDIFPRPYGLRPDQDKSREEVMRARVVQILIILGLALAATASPVAAASGSLVVGPGVGGGFFSMDGSVTWMAYSACYTGHVDDPDLPLDFRFALEFSLTGLPADATVTSATLSLHTPAANDASQTAVYGYAGDGSVQTADAAVGGASVVFTPQNSNDRVNYDVTALLTPGVVAAGWAGFSVRQEPLGGTFAIWSCPADVLFPVLTVNYTTPDPVVDEDSDGVVDAADLCPGTVVDAFADLKPNRYTYDGTALVSEFPHNPPYTIQQTGGCSASQIMAAMDVGGPDRFGLSRPKLEAWVGSVP